MIKKVKFSKIKNRGFFRFEGKLWVKYRSTEAQVMRGKSMGDYCDFGWEHKRCDTLVTPANARVIVEKQ